MKRAAYSVVVGGTDITSKLTPRLNSLTVTDKAGQSSDTASIDVDDTDGLLVLPQPGALMVIRLGWADAGTAMVFRGTVDEVQATGSRSGRTVTISAKGMDTRGKAKQGQRRHFDDTSVADALKAVGSKAGISVVVDADLGSTVREYIGLDDESFVAFGERMAREVGGTFKIVGDTAVLAKRNGGTSGSGAALAGVTASWGVNLHSYSIKPILGRPVEAETLTRWYDKAKAKWMSVTASTGTDGGKTTKPALYAEPDAGRAEEQSKSDAAESDRKSGEGSVTIEGEPAAQPEAICTVANCRPGVDGAYRIESVQHSYSRGGFTTTLELKQPKGSAGKDAR